MEKEDNENVEPGKEKKRSGKNSTKSSEDKKKEEKSREEKKKEDTENISDLKKPDIFEFDFSIPPKDPVKEQKKKDVVKKKKKIPTKTDSTMSSKIEPTMSERMGLHYVNEGLYPGYGPRPTYILRRTKKQQAFFLKNRSNTAKKFCKKRSVKVPKPDSAKQLDLKVEVPSPEASQAKVVPRRITPTPSWLYPYPQTEDELKLKKPKSGIIINVKDAEGKDATADYDSFDLVFTRTPRPGEPQKRKGKKKRKHKELEDIMEDDEETAGGQRRKGKKKQKGSLKIEEVEEEEMEEMEEQEPELGGEEFGDLDLKKLEEYLTKQFRRKVSQILEKSYTARH